MSYETADISTVAVRINSEYQFDVRYTLMSLDLNAYMFRKNNSNELFSL